MGRFNRLETFQLVSITSCWQGLSNVMTPQAALKKHVTGRIIARQGELSVPERHQLSIARKSMKMHCAGLAIMGGPNHKESAAIIHELTGAIVAIDAGCTCC